MQQPLFGKQNITCNLGQTLFFKYNNGCLVAKQGYKLEDSNYKTEQLFFGERNIRHKQVQK